MGSSSIAVTLPNVQSWPTSSTVPTLWAHRRLRTRRSARGTSQHSPRGEVKDGHRRSLGSCILIWSRWWVFFLNPSDKYTQVKLDHETPSIWIGQHPKSVWDTLFATNSDSLFQVNFNICVILHLKFLSLSFSSSQLSIQLIKLLLQHQ